MRPVIYTSRDIQDASYVRLRNVNIGYNRAAVGDWQIESDQWHTDQLAGAEPGDLD